MQINEVNLAMGGVELDLSGEMNFSENGLLFGKLSLWIANYERLVSILGSNLPDYTEMINTLLPTIISGFPTQDKNGISGREIPIKIVNGAVKIGFFQQEIYHHYHLNNTIKTKIPHQTRFIEKISMEIY